MSAFDKTIYRLFGDKRPERKDLLRVMYNDRQSKIDLLQKKVDILTKSNDYYLNWDKLVRDDEGLTAIDTILASDMAMKCKKEIDSIENADASEELE